MTGVAITKTVKTMSMLIHSNENENENDDNNKTTVMTLVVCKWQ